MHINTKPTPPLIVLFVILVLTADLLNSSNSKQELNSLSQSMSYSFLKVSS